MADRDLFITSATPRSPARSAADRDTAVRDPIVLAEMAALLQKVERAQASYGPRIEALRLGCEAAGLAIPGGAEAGPAPPSAATAVIAYLARQLRDDQALDRAVRLAVSRMAEVGRLADLGRRTLADGRVAPRMMEDLRRELYFLGHLYETFRHDAVLSRVFPAPKLLEQQAPDPRVRREQRLAANAVLVRAQAIVKRLAGPMAGVRRTIAILDRHTLFDARDMLEPSTRTARLTAVSLVNQPAAAARLRKALERYDRLTALVEKASPDDDPAPLTALASSLDAVAIDFRADPLLRPLFPPDPVATYSKSYSPTLPDTVQAF